MNAQKIIAVLIFVALVLLGIIEFPSSRTFNPSDSTGSSKQSESCIPTVQQEFQARVVGVSDGDTIKVVTPDQRAIRVRLDGIDAPERDQDFSYPATEALTRRVADREVTIQVTGIDGYDRTSASLWLME